MHNQRRRKAPRLLVFRAAAVFILALVFSVSSFSTVMANTVSANVIDGEQSYTFPMESAELDRILAQAERMGLQPLGPLDLAEQVENTTTVNIRRGMPVTVTENGTKTNLIAYRGDSVAKTLADNNIFLKDGDEVSPDPDTPVSAGLSVEVRRLCRVTVTADGESRQLSLTGGTVEDALREAKVNLAGLDSANYGQEETLFDNMHIRVSRTVRLRITADGATRDYQVSAGSVRAALAKCGIELSEDDRLNVGLKDRPTDGMEIVVTRASVEEVTEQEEIPYPIQYITSDSMYEDQEEIRSYGQPGIRLYTYKHVYVDGELTDVELVAEEVVQEPVPAVVAKGTLVRESSETQEDPQLTEDGAAGVVPGTDFSYVDTIVGSCTAYYPLQPGDITSTGVVAGYGCVAVDPNLIPYGTTMYITSVDGSVVYGYGVAVDTGGFVGSGTLADLCYDTEEECSIIGRRDMIIYILHWGY